MGIICDLVLETCKRCDNFICVKKITSVIESPVRPFHPIESPLIIISEHQKLSEQKIFLLGNEIFVRATSKGIQFQPNLPDSRYTPRTAPRTAVSLDYQEFGQLLEFSNFLKSALRKRPAHTETLVNPLFANGPHTSLDVLSRYQTKFLFEKTALRIRLWIVAPAAGSLGKRLT